MDLNRAEQRRAARKQIAQILGELEVSDRFVVLEDLLADEHDNAPVAHLVRRGDRPVVALNSALAVALANGTKKAVASESSEEDPVWKRIEDYCLAHPTVDGIYTAREVGQALKLHENLTLAATFAGSAVKRKSTNSDRTVRNPRFEWIGAGAGKFRLARAHGQEGG